MPPWTRKQTQRLDASAMVEHHPIFLGRRRLGQSENESMLVRLLKRMGCRCRRIFLLGCNRQSEVCRSTRSRSRGRDWEGGLGSGSRRDELAPVLDGVDVPGGGVVDTEQGYGSCGMSVPKRHSREGNGCVTRDLDGMIPRCEPKMERRDNCYLPNEKLVE